MEDTRGARERTADRWDCDSTRRRGALLPEACVESRSVARGIGITRDEWLKALKDVGQDDDDQSALTVTEFRTMLNLKRNKAQSLLDALVAAKKAVRTTKRVADSQGRRQLLTAYKLQ